MNRHLVLFLGPCVAALMAFFIVPVWQTFVMSVHADTMAPNPAYVGLANYIAVASDRNFVRLMTTSVLYTAGNVIFVWLIGLGIALLLNRNFVGRGLVRAAFIVPWATPYVAASLIFSLMFNYDVGILNYLLGLLSYGQLRIDYLTSCPNALISLTGISVWKLLPLGIVMMLTGLQSIPETQYEAARVDGATGLQRFWFVTLPGLRSTTITLTLLMMIWCFGRSFTAIYLLTGGGPAGCSETLVLKSYLQMFQLFKPATAATLGVGVLLISLVFAIAYIMVLAVGSRKNG
ncbi:carbohydrate ABC transporter permease [Oryzicola mucosus]|uniref:Sugar ABC transporter permease n=1 Tax=Oryzicola mucosus TaxID=2767425 RepID=A0A8J6PYS1_9HYPH|nr:sugar ABC transporter permease [Oryzicola mucosus]MBD0416792.1 sugar ABC transporter permease [Oryzicola mucosus]